MPVYTRSAVYGTLVAAALSVSAQADAAMYCISTVSGLNASMDAANNAAEGTVQDLRLRPGTYNVPAGLIFDPAGDKDGKDFSITGGWNLDCSARVTNAAATIVNAENGSLDGEFAFKGNNTRYVVEGIRYTNFHYFSLDDDNCGLDCPDTSAIRVRYNEFRNGVQVTITARDAAALTVTNNLFANIDPDFLVAVGIGYQNSEQRPVFAFNTIAGTDCGPGGDALYVHTQRAGMVLHHNIVQSVGCGGDITVANVQPVALRNNLYGSLAGLAPSLLSGNVISTDPRFVNAAGGDYHLKETAPASAAINAGLTPATLAALGLAGDVPSQDLDGPAGMRLVGVQHDIGAYESSINNASVLTVTKTADTNDGLCNSDCSFREAITAANAAPGAQKIAFAMPGNCPQLISLGSVLPDIVDDVEIDGYSQPGASANTATNGSDAELCVVLLAQSGTLAQALQVPAAAPASTSLTLKGLAVAGTTGFNGNFSVGLRLRGGADHIIQGNAFGGTGPGSIGDLGTLPFGIQIRDSAQHALIGGPDPEQRNTIGGTSSSAIVLNDATSSGHTLQNNYIGLSASGINAEPIGLNGIFASNSPTIQILDNVIAAVANSPAIAIQGATATGYTIRGNRLGVNAFGIPTAAFRNQVGIQFADATHDHIVGSNNGTVSSNQIVNSDDAGVWISPTAGSGILVRPNQIYSNGQSGLGLGIDLGTLGPSVNDLGDGDSGPNGLQNWPQVLSSMPNADGSRQVTVQLDSTPAKTYRIDVYRAPSCPAGNRGGDMLTRIGTVVASTNAQGSLTQSLAMSGGGAPGVLVAMATRTDTNDSSEPGSCYLEPIATTTTITNDSPDPSAFGQPYTVTVLVNAASGTPTGTVTISDGAGNQCTDDTLSGGIGSCQLLSTSLGSKTLTASYGGSFSHAPSSGTATHQVVQVSTTTTITSDTPDPSEVGQAYTVNVQVRTPAGNLAVPSGSVTISDGDAQVCAPIVLDVNGNGSCQAISQIPGNKTLQAVYAGNANVGGSSDTEPHIVTSAVTTTTITSDAPDPSIVGQAYTVQVSVSANAGAGAVFGSVSVNDGSGASCNIAALVNGSGSCQLSSQSAGAKTLSASYTPASASFVASSDTEPHMVNPAGPAATTTQINTHTPDPSVVGQPYTVSVTVSSAGATPTGTVSINDGAGGASCQAPLNAGTASCQLSSTSAGARLLTACLQANASFAGSCANTNHQVNKAGTDLVIAAVQPVSGVSTSIGVQLSVQAPGAGTPTGTVSISANAGEQCQYTLPASGCAISFVGAGPRTLTVSYGGDANYTASQRQQPITVVADALLQNGFE